MRLAFAAVLLATVAFAFASGSASAQSEPEPGFEACGDTENLVLVFLNPDVSQFDENRRGHATGKFFVQFQARGPKAMDIDSLYFSFGKPAHDQNVCDLAPEWYTDGAFIKNYRADFDWQDGFFVPINTLNVPDGEYIAALSAYDSAGRELVRYWGRYLVENGCTRLGCQPQDYVAQDKTMPWPMVLPGDGERMDGKSGLYIEVGEPVQEIKAWLGTHEGQKLIELTEVSPPPRDDDAIPDFPPGTPLAGPKTLECPAGDPEKTNFCAKRWGQAWEWAGVIAEEQVIRVRLVDLNGNVAEKVLHVGDPTIGGRVTAGTPELVFELDSPDKSTDENGRAVWNVTYKSTNDDGVHGDVFVRNADGTPIAAPFTARLTPNHVMMGGKEQRNGTVMIIAGPGTAPGSYAFELVVNYAAGTVRIDKTTMLKLSVVDRASEDPDKEEKLASTSGERSEDTRGSKLEASNATIVAPEEIERSTPFASPVSLAAAGAVAAAVAARRRRERS